MKDLTQGSIAGHLISIALPTAAGMLFQTLYYFVDLYFVGRLGEAAVAGVSAGGIVMLVILTLTQMLGVGTGTLISHAVGRRDQRDANLIFNQSLSIAAAFGALTLVVGYMLTVPYLRFVAADEATVEQGRAYLRWFLPGLALQLTLVSMASALRATGIVKPGIVAQVMSVLLNTALAPVLIAGWGTGYVMGVAGAGLASSIAVFACVVLLWLYHARRGKYLSFDPQRWWPQLIVWKRMLKVGLPTSGELLLISANATVTLWAISSFGAATQAGFGIGSRIMQGIYLPALAIAAAIAPVAGQNFGGGQMARVHKTFRIASRQSMAIVLAAIMLCHWQSETMVRIFSHDTEVIRVGVSYLRLISWNLIAGVAIFVCSAMFQALGNTTPSLLSSASQLLSYFLPLTWLTSHPGYKLEYVWYLSIAATVLQAALNLAMLRRQIRCHLLHSPAMTADHRAQDGFARPSAR